MNQFSIQSQNIKSSSRKWLPALAPAIAMSALVVVFWNQPIPQPIVVATAIQDSTDIVLPLSSTMLVGSNLAAKPVILRGRLTVFNPQIIASPTGGMVARLLVQPGQMVKAGETIAMISNQSLPAVDKSRVQRQERAEAAQEAANRQQSILQGKLAQEKVLLEAANQRVDKAAKRLADARELLRRLQNGEKISRTQINNVDSSDASPPSRETEEQNTTASAETIATAQQVADQLAKVAAQKWQVLHVLLTRQQAAKSSQANADTAPTQNQVEAARAKAKSAQEAADKARMKVYNVTVANSTKTKPALPSNTSNSTFITINDATQIANAALQESNDALAQVKTIQHQIQRYQEPVKSANTNFQAATSNLENTQRSLFDNPVKVPMTPVVATSNGIVHRLATLAMQVDVGDEIASITPANLLNLEIRDSNEVWKNLQVNSKFEVLVQTTSDPQKQIATDARLVAITPPKSSDQPALLHIQVFNPVAPSSMSQKPQPTEQPADRENTVKPAATPRVFSPGMIAVCPIPSADTAIVVPRKALFVNASHEFQIAVLKPQNADPISQIYAVQWNNVSIKTDDGSSANVTISSGLNKDDRIALEPKMLYSLSRTKGASVSVKLSDS